MEKLKLLALSGSLRNASYNTAAIQALKILAPDYIDITAGEIADLPLFNPDRETEKIHALDKLKSDLKQSSGLIISSPEYAHGISAPMKNALDWLVSGDEFPYIPIMLINTSPRATHALESLKEILKTMSGNIIESAHVSIPLLGSELDAAGIIASHKMVANLRSGLGVFYNEIRNLDKHAPSNTN